MATHTPIPWFLGMPLREAREWFVKLVEIQLSEQG